MTSRRTDNPTTISAIDLCNACDANPADPADPAGNCAECRGGGESSSEELPTGTDLVELLDQAGDAAPVIDCTDPECGRSVRFDAETNQWQHTTARALGCFALAAEPFVVDTVGPEGVADVYDALEAAGITTRRRFWSASTLALGIEGSGADDRIEIDTDVDPEDFTRVVGGLDSVLAISGPTA